MRGRLTKLTVGGAAAGAIVLALLWGRFSWLGGGGTGDGDAGDARVGIDSQPVNVERPIEPDRPEEGPDRPIEEPPPQEPPDVLHVVVEEQGYSLKETRNGGVHYRPLPLEELVALARRTPRTEGRARVHITMRRQAKGADQQLLVQKLVDAGIPRDAIEGGQEVRLED
ncbi:MAG: hypothetical protein WED34_05355 [Planctomycetales bacterium]